MSDDILIEARGLTRRFGSRLAVDRVGFEIRRGEAVAVFGPNGAGKTTLLRILCSALKPTAGSVELFGLDYRRHAEQIRSRIGVISHSSYLYDDLSARDNLVFFARLYGVPDPASAADRMLDAMELGARAVDAAKTFSRGMTQRLSIARSLVHDPEIVFLDEPFSGLDPHAAAVLRDALEALRVRRRTLVMVTHDIPLGLATSGRYLLMAGGRVVEDGSSEGQDPARFASMHFGARRGAEPS